jgi:hypothetical protein
MAIAHIFQKFNLLSLINLVLVKISRIQLRVIFFLINSSILVEHRGSSFHKNRDASAIQRNDTLNESENQYNGQIDGADS